MTAHQTWVEWRLRVMGVLRLLRGHLDGSELSKEELVPMIEEVEKLAPSTTAAPIPIRLNCPECGELHIDEDEFATKTPSYPFMPALRAFLEACNRSHGWRSLPTGLWGRPEADRLEGRCSTAPAPSVLRGVWVSLQLQRARSSRLDVHRRNLALREARAGGDLNAELR